MKLNNHTPQRFRRDGFLGIFGRKVDLVDHYEKKLQDLEDNVRLEQSSSAGKVCYLSPEIFSNKLDKEFIECFPIKATQVFFFFF